MKVGMEPDAFLLEYAGRESLSYADALRGYGIEAMLRRIYRSAFGEFLWLKTLGAIGTENYRKQKEIYLDFFYAQSEKYIAPDKIVPGAAWSEALAGQLQKELFETAPIELAAPCRREGDGLLWIPEIVYREMRIPVAVRVFPLQKKGIVPEQKEILLSSENGQPLTVYVYSAENRLAEDFYNIMKLLELIPDMGAYARVNQILKTEPINGRHIMEMLEERAAAEPRQFREKRLEQLAGYREYAYMRKRWVQYERRNGGENEPWEDVLDRIMRFAKPVWGAVCRKEVFFDDWMPELSRFLG